MKIYYSPDTKDFGITKDVSGDSCIYIPLLSEGFGIPFSLSLSELEEISIKELKNPQIFYNQFFSFIMSKAYSSPESYLKRRRDPNWQQVLNYSLEYQLASTISPDLFQKFLIFLSRDRRFL